MNIERFSKYITAETLMGPNSLRVLDELFARHPLTLTEEDAVLDLGCGKGLTSFAIARETPAKVFASDLWIPAEENAARFAQWGVQDQIIPCQEDANALHFAPGTFDALISVDAYHYFGTQSGFFAEKILPILKDGAEVLIGVPGMKPAFSGQSEELLTDWLGNEAYMFRSPAEWREIIGRHERIREVETWEMACFDAAWNDWLATRHEFALGDERFFDTLIRPYTSFVGIHVTLR